MQDWREPTWGLKLAIGSPYNTRLVAQLKSGDPQGRTPREALTTDRSRSMSPSWQETEEFVAVARTDDERPLQRADNRYWASVPAPHGAGTIVIGPGRTGAFDRPHRIQAII